jgi:hypothetical protein
VADGLTPTFCVEVEPGMTGEAGDPPPEDCFVTT